MSVLKLWVLCSITVTLTLYLSLPTSLELGKRNTVQEFHLSSSQPVREDTCRHYNKTNSTAQTSVWIVVDATSTTCGTSELKFLQYSKLNVVIVSRDGTRYQWCRSPTCVQLTPTECYHDLMQWSTSKIFKCPSRLSGYLFALSKGATGIVDTDCHIPVNYVDAVLQLNDRYSYTCLKYNGTGHVTLYNYINSLPISSTTCNTFYQEYYNNSFIKPKFKFYLQELDTVDVIQIVPFQERQTFSEYRRKNIPSDLPLISPSSTTLAPLTHSTIYFSGLSLLWLFVHPVFPVWFSSLFRTLWLHAVRQNIDVSVGYLPVLVNDFPDSNHIDLCPFHKDSTVSTLVSSGQVVDCVQKLRCEDTQWSSVCTTSLAGQVFHCLVPLAGNISVKTEDFLQTLAAWMDDVFMVTGDYIHATEKDEEKHDRVSDTVVQVTLGYRIEHDHDSVIFRQSVFDQHILRFMKEMCPVMVKNLTTIRHRWLQPVIKDIALVISVNDRPLSDTIPYLEYIHRQYFLHIVYCGSSEQRFREFIDQTQLDFITYITGLDNNHTNLYSCLAHAMTLAFPVRGYLLIHQHVLLNSWKLSDLPRDQVWLPRGFSKRAEYKTKSLNRWMKWNSKSDRSSIVKVLDELSRDSSDANINQKTKKFAQNFLRNYHQNLQTDYPTSDSVQLFYIPDSLRSDYIMAAGKFSKFNTSVNMAVPCIHFGLAGTGQVRYLPGSSLSGENSKRPWNYFLHYNSYSLYPFDPVVHLQSPSGRKFFCQEFLREMEKFLRPKS